MLIRPYDSSFRQSVAVGRLPHTRCANCREQITKMSSRRTVDKSQKKRGEKPITLAPLDFETALRAAMATGKAPPMKPKKAKRKAKK